MLNLFQKYRRLGATSARIQREDFCQYFFSIPEHAWMSEDANTFGVFKACFERLPSALLATLLRQPLLFIPSQVFKSEGAARFQMNNTVVIFPEFQKLFKRGAVEAVAFVAHELALVLYELENPVDKDPLMAEVEADKFVCDMGLADELEQLLLSMDESTEKRLRLTYLTFKSLGIN